MVVELSLTLALLVIRGYPAAVAPKQLLWVSWRVR